MATLTFQYTRYKVGDHKRQRRLEQKALDASGKPPLVRVKAPRKNEAPIAVMALEDDAPEIRLEGSLLLENLDSETARTIAEHALSDEPDPFLRSYLERFSIL